MTWALTTNESMKSKKICRLYQNLDLQSISVNTIHVGIILLLQQDMELSIFMMFLFDVTLVKFERSLQFVKISTFESFHRKVTSPSLLTRQLLSPRLKDSPSLSVFQFSVTAFGFVEQPLSHTVSCLSVFKKDERKVPIQLFCQLKQNRFT